MTTDNAQANPLDAWRQFITDSERQWNSFFKEVLGTDQFSNGMNAWVEASLTVQRMVADQLERLYTTFNIPTHGDLVDLGERMKAIEDALVTLQTQVATKRPASAKRTAARPKPARTRKPAGASAGKNGAG